MVPVYLSVYIWLYHVCIVSVIHPGSKMNGYNWVFCSCIRAFYAGADHVFPPAWLLAFSVPLIALKLRYNVRSFVISVTVNYDQRSVVMPCSHRQLQETVEFRRVLRCEVNESATVCGNLEQSEQKNVKTRVMTIVTIGLSLRPIVALSDDYWSR